MKKTRFERVFPNYKKQDKWFSWGWVIFWIIFFYPAAIIYLILKFAEKRQYNKG